MFLDPAATIVLTQGFHTFYVSITLVMAAGLTMIFFFSHKQYYYEYIYLHGSVGLYMHFSGHTWGMVCT